MPREFLGVNNDGVDQHLRGGYSHFVNKVPVLGSNIHRELVRVEATNTPSAGGEVIFNLPRAWDITGHVIFSCDIAAPVASAGTAELQDYVGFRLWTEARVTWANNQNQILRADDAMKWTHLSRTSENSYAGLVHGDLTQADRQALAAATTNVLVPLPFYWTGSPACYLPNNSEVLRQNLTIGIRLAAVNQYCCTPSGTISSGGTLSNFYLYVEVFHLGQQELEAVLAEKAQMNNELKTVGFCRLVTTFEGQYAESLSASTAEQTIKLSSIRRPSRALMFSVVHQTDRPTSGENATPNHFNFRAVTSYRLQSGGRELAISRTHRLGLLWETNSMFSAAPSKNIYVIPWSVVPQAWSNQWGYINFNGTGSVSLLVTLASATAAYCDITEIAHNIYCLGPTGDLRMLYV